MRIVCWQTILKKYHALFFSKKEKMSQNLSSAAVVIGALRVNSDNQVDLIGPSREFNDLFIA